MNKEERKEKLEAELQGAAEAEHVWKTFMEHPGWAKYSAFLKEQMELRKQTVTLTPVNSVGQCFAQEFYKGECQGISTALETPRAQLELAQMERRIATKQLESEDEPEDEVSAEFDRRLDGSPYGGEPA